MRKLLLVPAVLLLGVILPDGAAAQQAEEPVSFTGCLAQEDHDGKAEYLLKNVAGETSMDQIELAAAKGVDLAPHVGHTVKATGMLTADHENAGDEEMAEMDDEDEGAVEDQSEHVVLKVTGISHVSASCDRM